MLTKCFRHKFQGDEDHGTLYNRENGSHLRNLNVFGCFVQEIIWGRYAQTGAFFSDAEGTKAPMDEGYTAVPRFGSLVLSVNGKNVKSLDPKDLASCISSQQRPMIIEFFCYKFARDLSPSSLCETLRSLARYPSLPSIPSSPTFQAYAAMEYRIETLRKYFHKASKKRCKLFDLYATNSNNQDSLLLGWREVYDFMPEEVKLTLATAIASKIEVEREVSHRGVGSIEVQRVPTFDESETHGRRYSSISDLSTMSSTGT